MKEEIEDIQVQVDRSYNVFLWTVFVHQHVGVKNDEERKDKGSSYTNSLVHQWRWEK
jgi:hypothetical protein